MHIMKHETWAWNIFTATDLTAVGGFRCREGTEAFEGSLAHDATVVAERVPAVPNDPHGRLGDGYYCVD